MYLRLEHFVDFFLASNGVAYYPGFFPELKSCIPDMEKLLSTAKSLVPPTEFESSLRGYYRVPTSIARDTVPYEEVFWNIFSIDTNRDRKAIIRFNLHSQFVGSEEDYFARASKIFWEGL